MKVFAKFLTSIVIVLIMSTQIHAVKMDNNINTVIELGKQISNLESMISNYVAIGAKIKFKDPINRLNENIKEYESILDLLNKKYANDSTIKESIKKSRNIWKATKKKLLIAEVKSNTELMKKEVMFIHKNIHNLELEMKKMKKYILKSIKSINHLELNAAINISISAYGLAEQYMIKMWKFTDPTIIKYWDSSVIQYKKSIAILQKSTHYKNPEFKEWLDKTGKILDYTIMSFSMIDGNPIPSMIYNKCETADKLANEMALKIIATK